MKGANRLLQVLLQLLQAVKQNIVVVARLPGIASPRITGDPAALCRSRIDGFGRLGVVIGGTDDDGARPRYGNAQRRSQQAVGFIAPLQIFHLAGIAALNPWLEVTKLGGLLAGRRNGSNAGLRKSRLLGQRGNLIVQDGGRLLHDQPVTLAASDSTKARFCSKCAGTPCLSPK